MNSAGRDSQQEVCSFVCRVADVWSSHADRYTRQSEPGPPWSIWLPWQLWLWEDCKVDAPWLFWKETKCEMDMQVQDIISQVPQSLRQLNFPHPHKSLWQTDEAISFTMWLIRSPFLPSERALHPIHLPFLVEVDPCVTNPCLHGGKCLPQGTGYSCYCPQGYAGENCEIGEQRKHTRLRLLTHSSHADAHTHTCAALFWVAFLFFLLILSIYLQWIDFSSL